MCEIDNLSCEKTLKLCMDHDDWMERLTVAELTGEKDLGAMNADEARQFAYSYV
jgi:hypothetical protein